MASIYIFLDNSNIFIASQTVGEEKEGLVTYKSAPVRLHFRNLLRLADCGRDVSGTFSVGSAAHKEHFVWEKMEDLTGVHSAIYERGRRSCTEQAVDETLQLAMYRALVNEPEPQVAVLLTGDGKGFDEGVGFLKALYDMHERGWGIEVLSWELSCHHDLKDFAEKNGVFVPLDTYYYAITYLPEGRSAKPLTLVNRKMAKPDPSRSESSRLYSLGLNYDTLKTQYGELQRLYEELEQKYASVMSQQEELDRKKGRYDKSMKAKKQKSPVRSVKKEEKAQPKRDAPAVLRYEYPMPDNWCELTG